jgi:hypothetical protein
MCRTASEFITIRHKTPENKNRYNPPPMDPMKILVADEVSETGLEPLRAADQNTNLSTGVLLNFRLK